MSTCTTTRTANKLCEIRASRRNTHLSGEFQCRFHCESEMSIKIGLTAPANDHHRFQRVQCHVRHRNSGKLILKLEFDIRVALTQFAWKWNSIHFFAEAARANQLVFAVEHHHRHPFFMRCDFRFGSNTKQTEMPEPLKCHTLTIFPVVGSIARFDHFGRGIHRLIWQTIDSERFFLVGGSFRMMQWFGVSVFGGQELVEVTHTQWQRSVMCPLRLKHRLDLINHSNKWKHHIPAFQWLDSLLETDAEIPSKRIIECVKWQNEANTSLIDTNWMERSLPSRQSEYQTVCLETTFQRYSGPTKNSIHNPTQWWQSQKQMSNCLKTVMASYSALSLWLTTLMRNGCTWK